MEILQALHDSGLAAALRRADTFYPFLNAFHILSLGVVVGAIGTLDLRLLGLFKGSAVAQLAPPLSRMAAAGVACAIVTGFLLFSVRPAAYAENGPFLVKMGLTAAGIANALILHARASWRTARAGGAVTPAVKIAAAVSLAIWTGAVVAGRWIAFVE